jgi:hypothetical protein
MDARKLRVALELVKAEPSGKAAGEHRAVVALVGDLRQPPAHEGGGESGEVAAVVDWVHGQNEATKDSERV